MTDAPRQPPAASLTGLASQVAGALAGTPMLLLTVLLTSICVTSVSYTFLTIEANLHSERQFLMQFCFNTLAGKKVEPPAKITRGVQDPD